MKIGRLASLTTMAFLTDLSSDLVMSHKHEYLEDSAAVSEQLEIVHGSDVDTRSHVIDTPEPEYSVEIGLEPPRPRD